MRINVSGDRHEMAMVLTRIADRLQDDEGLDGVGVFECPIDGQKDQLVIEFEQAFDNPELGTLAQIEYDT